MIQPEFRDLVFKFAKGSARDDVASIFLFGSVAKGTADNRSDVDLLVVLDTYTNDFESLENKKEISELALYLEKEYDRAVQVVFTNKIFHGLDEHIVQHVMQEGILLYANPPEIQVEGLSLTPYVLFICDFSVIERKQKSRIKRLLYGHSTKKTVKGRTYESVKKGLLEELNGIRTGSGDNMVPQNMAHQLGDFFNKFQVKYKMVTMWLTKEDAVKLSIS